MSLFVYPRKPHPVAELRDEHYLLGVVDPVEDLVTAVHHLANLVAASLGVSLGDGIGPRCVGEILDVLA